MYRKIVCTSAPSFPPSHPLFTVGLHTPGLHKLGPWKTSKWREKRDAWGSEGWGEGAFGRRGLSAFRWSKKLMTGLLCCEKVLLGITACASEQRQKGAGHRLHWVFALFVSLRCVHCVKNKKCTQSSSLLHANIHLWSRKPSNNELTYLQEIKNLDN